MSHSHYSASGKDRTLPLFETAGTAPTVIPTCYDANGLIVIHDYVDSRFAEYIVEKIDTEADTAWRTDLKRRVQHFGYLYDYRARRVDPSMRLGELPDWAYFLGRQLVFEHLFDRLPDQVIVNEYEPGQGIAAHIDAESCFGDVVASLSLLSDCVMTLRARNHSAAIDVDLPANSLMVLSGPARHEWTHAIASRSTDSIMGVQRKRHRRISATFRTILP
jgi:alkylated DNA repair dioxygenase AlkB